MKKTQLEKYIKSSLIPLYFEGLETILFQMKSCICKMFKGNNIRGLFCKIPFQNNLLPVLITNNHILDKEDIKLGKITNFTLYNNKEIRVIKINESRKRITREELDITIIEIKSDEDKINNFLEIEEDVNKDKEIFE